MYSHDYIDKQNYFSNILVKTNVAEQLERQLASQKWQQEVVNLGGITDNYQPAEAKYSLMPDVWRLLRKYKTPAIISTKSDLILRDYDLIAALSRECSVSIAVTVTTADYAMQKRLEPHAVDPDRRLRVLAEFSKLKSLDAVGLHMMPIVPYITDSYDNLDTLLDCAKRYNVSYVIPAMLNLRGTTKPAFMSFLERELPQIHTKMLALYGKDKELMQQYKRELYGILNNRLAYHRVKRWG
jgi:DNA repair photolyase